MGTWQMQEAKARLSEVVKTLKVNRKKLQCMVNR
jgi:hypothetical protein